MAAQAPNRQLPWTVPMPDYLQDRNNNRPVFNVFQTPFILILTELKDYIQEDHTIKLSSFGHRTIY